MSDYKEYDGIKIAAVPMNADHVGTWVVMANYSYTIRDGGTSWFGSWDIPTFTVSGTYADALAKTASIITVRTGDRITRGEGKERFQRHITDVFMSVVDA